MKTFKSFCLKLIQPNPKVYPDPHQAKLLLAKNLSIFKIHIFCALMPLLLAPTSNLPISLTLIRTAVFTINFIIFLIFCRSYPRTGHIVNTLLLNVGSSLVVRQQAGVYFNLGMAFASPLGVYFFTQNVLLSGWTSSLHLFILITKFKYNLKQELWATDPDIFTEKFVGGFINAFIGVQAIYLYLLYSLNKKTTELSKATKSAEDALDQQKTFMYSFSHEMRNPMNSLLGNLDLVLMTEISYETREMINTAKTCGIILLNLINTVLDAGKLHMGKLEVKPVPTRVHDTLQRIWGISHDLIKQKGLMSHLKISKKVPPRLVLDGHRVSQVLMNLLGNAVKFTEKGAITVSIDWIENSGITEKCFTPVPYDSENEGIFEKENNMYAINRSTHQGNESASDLILAGETKEFGMEGVLQPPSETNGVLKIVIKDSGCGIIPQDLAKLFQKFSQVGEDVSKKQMGTGLGLYISKEICKNLGGEIRAYSKLKIGTTFIVCIPTVALPVTSQSQLHVSLYGIIIPRIKAKCLKALVADDSPFNVNIVCQYYSKLGVEVVAKATNGQMAYEKYLEKVRMGVQVDIVALDIDMPVMNGKEALEKMRENERRMGLKPATIMLISGNYEEANLGYLLDERNRNKADFFLRKPLIFDEFCWNLYKHVCAEPSATI